MKNTKERTVYVYGLHYDPYADDLMCNTTYKRIAEISPANARKILRLMADAKADKSECGHYLNADYQIHAGNGDINEQLELRLNAMPRDVVPSCRGMFYSDGFVTKKHCLANFSTGKCTDPLMRKIGAVLWPEIYGKGK